MEKYYHLKKEKDCNIAAKKYDCTNYKSYIKGNYWGVVIKVDWLTLNNAWLYNDFKICFPETKLLNIDLSYDL